MLSIEPLSVFGLPPVEFARLAAALDVPAIGLMLSPFPDNPHGYARYDLREDAAMRRETKAALADTGVVVALGEGFMFMPDVTAQHFARDLDLIAELGAPRINTISLDPDIARSRDEMAALAGMAAERGMATVIEFCPFMSVKTLDDAVATVTHMGQGVTIMVDTLHAARLGLAPADLAAVDPALIGYIQLCDAPAIATEAVPYQKEAAVERRAPGDGELPLAAMLAALPRGLPVGLEIPILSEAERGVGPKDRLRRCVAGARALLGEA